MLDHPYAPTDDRLKAPLDEALSTPDIKALSYLAMLCAAYGAEATARINQRLGLSDKAPSGKGTPILERWLTPAEGAQLLRISTKSLSRRWRELSFCRPSPTKRGFRVSQTGLHTYMSRTATLISWLAPRTQTAIL